MCFAAAPFNYWRGTIRFRFQVVASAYHRGRLRVVYDPSGVYVNQPLNTGYSYIIDLAKERDFVVDIGWTATTGFLRTGGIAGGNPVNSLTAPENVARDYSNGAIKLEVLSALTTPSESTDPVYVNIYASTTDDFEVAAPILTTMEELTPLGPQSGMVPQSGAVDMHEGSVECDPCLETVSVALAKPPGTVEQSLLTYSGEVITSFRQVLKRYSFNRSQIVRFGYQSDIFPTYPVFPGLDPNGFEKIGADRYNAASMTPLGWVMMSFVAYRGGMRLLLMSNCVNTSGIMTVSNLGTEGVADQRRTVWALVDGLDDITSRPENVMRLQRLSHNGQHIVNHAQNGALCAEIPYYSYKKFLLGRKKTQTGTGEAGDYRLVRVTFDQRVTQTNTNYSIYHSIGEDFQVGMYLGPPILYVAATPTTEFTELSRP
jgi:hypothetical protein